MPDIDQGVQSGSTNTGTAPQVSTGSSGSGAPSQGSVPQDVGARQGQPGAGGQQSAQGDSERNWAAVRQQLDELKSKYEPWEKLNVKPDQVTQFQGVYQKLYGEAGAIGRELGYPDDEIADALAEDPVRTLDFLRNEAARMQQGQPQQDGDLQSLVAQHVQQAIGPIQQRENVRATNEANALFERTAYQTVVEAFKNEGIDPAQIPEQEKYMIMTAASEILKYDDAALQALKYEGKTAGVQAAVKEALSELDKYYLARAGRDRGRVRTAQPGQPPQNGQDQPYKPTLDDMINDPTAIDRARGRTGDAMRYR